LYNNDLINCYDLIKIILEGDKVKRLVRKAESQEGEFEQLQGDEKYDEYQDPYLGRYVEIVNKRSKYFGYHAWVDDKMATHDQYKIYLEPKNYDEPNFEGKYIVNFVSAIHAEKWFNIVE
jgi:hypothetical protein